MSLLPPLLMWVALLEVEMVEAPLDLTAVNQGVSLPLLTWAPLSRVKMSSGPFKSAKKKVQSAGVDEKCSTKKDCHVKLEVLLA